EVAVEQRDTLRRVVEHDPQGGLAAGELLGALLGDLFEPSGGLGALGEELVELDSVLSKYLDRPAHRGDLVRTLRVHDHIAPAAGDRRHVAAEPGEARDNVAPDIEPYDQEGARQAQRRDGEKDVASEVLHAPRFGVGAVDIFAREGDELVDRLFQSYRKRLVLGNQTPALGLGRHRPAHRAEEARIPDYRAAQPAERLEQFQRDIRVEIGNESVHRADRPLRLRLPIVDFGRFRGIE